MLVGLVIGLSSRIMCSSASVVMLFNSPFSGGGVLYSRVVGL